LKTVVINESLNFPLKVNIWKSMARKHIMNSNCIYIIYIKRHTKNDMKRKQSVYQ